MTEFFGEPISVYTADQSVEDGMLVKVPAELSKAPIYLTASVYALVEVPAGMEGEQDLMGRMHDVVMAARWAFSAGPRDDLMRTRIPVILAGHGTVNLWAVIDGAGLTIMLPEDY